MPSRPVDVLHVSTAATLDELDHIKSRTKPGVDAVSYGMIEASHKFHGLLARGIAAQDTRVRSLVGRSLGSAYEGGWWPRVVQRVAPNHVVDHTSAINAPVAKQLWLAAAAFCRTLAWRVATTGNPRRVLVVDASWVTALPGVMIALAGSDVVKLGLFMDIYPYMGDVADAKNRTEPGQGLLRRAAQECYRRLDGFLLLTDAMNEVVNPDGRPSIVIEGIVDSAHVAAEPSRDKDEHLTIMYAGALRAEYGIADLVTAFRGLDAPDARLVVYGGGPYSADVQSAAEADPRIDFRGYADVADVVAAEERAWLLVNPRPAGAEFTKYSFPSKVMEYLASGTAVASTRLPGIPAEYFEHLIPIEADGPQPIADTLAAAVATPRDELAARGRAGREFVRDVRSDTAVGARIMDLAARIGATRGAVRYGRDVEREQR